jgi:hypothetical protein
MADLADLVKVLQLQLQAQREEAKAGRELLMQQMETQREQMQQIIARVQGAGDGRSKLQDMFAQVQHFEHDPEKQLTIEPWLQRFQTIFASDEGKSFSEADKLAVLFGRLQSADYNSLADSVAPKKLETLTFEEIKKRLEKLFGRKESRFSRRYKTLRITKSDDEDFGSYTARINRAAQDFNFASFGIEDFKNQLFVQGLKSERDAVILKKALEKLNDHQTLLDAAAEQAALQAAAPEVEEAAPAAVSVRPLTIDDLRLFAERQQLIEKDRDTLEQAPTVTPVSASRKPPSQACHFCGGLHWHRDCPFKNQICDDL